MTYIKRNLANSIHSLLQRFPAVVVLGARQVGKSTLLKQVLPEAPFFDLEDHATLSRISADPGFFLSQFDGAIVLDEAQRAPDLFPALRVAIDKKRARNEQYLLSGSSSPLLLEGISETLAGRVAIIELNTFSLNESWRTSPSPLYPLIVESRFDGFAGLPLLHSTDQLLKSCLCGGYPEPFLKREDTAFFDLWMSNYFLTYVERDVRRLFPGLNMNTFNQFIRMLGNATGQLVNYSTFARSLNVSQPTARSYFQIAHGTFLWRHLESYEKSVSKSIVKMPKGHMRDSGLMNHVLAISNETQLQSHPHFGFIWESFIIEQLIRGMEAALSPFRYFFYRSRGGAEVDLVLEGRFGLIPVEVKVGTRTDQKMLTGLKQFMAQKGCPAGLIVNNSDQVCQLAENIYQIPAGCL